MRAALRAVEAVAEEQRAGDCACRCRRAGDFDIGAAVRIAASDPRAGIGRAGLAIFRRARTLACRRRLLAAAALMRKD